MKNIILLFISLLVTGYISYNYIPNQQYLLTNQNFTDNDLYNVDCLYFSSGGLICDNVTDIIINNFTTINNITNNITDSYWFNDTNILKTNFQDIFIDGNFSVKGINGDNYLLFSKYQLGINNFSLIKAIGNSRITFDSDDDSQAEMVVQSKGNTFFRFIPEYNGSAEVFLFNYKNSDARKGLVLLADAGERQFIPSANNQIDLGHNSYCWKDFYYYTLHDCGSPTETLYEKNAINLISQVAQAHITANQEKITDKSKIIINNQTIDNYIFSYYNNMPQEFKGEMGSCGHETTNTDEIINGLVLSIKELNDLRIQQDIEIQKLKDLMGVKE